ncbi:hypothetical protein GF389_01035 [Candidatus Dojkabacteria bacterium]|nr:hypothetical protein [Candidatus Dojkabacteria bacterium]
MEKMAENYIRKLRKYFDIYVFDLLFLLSGIVCITSFSLALVLNFWSYLFAVTTIITLIPNLILFLYKLVSYLPSIKFYNYHFGLKKPVKIVFLSDLHFHEFMPDDYYKKAFQEINKLKPDMIIFGGDFVHDQNTDFEQLKDLTILDAEDIVGVLGNHDYDIRSNEFRLPVLPSEKYKYADLVISELEENGVKILRNKNLKIGELNIFGLDSLWARKNDLSKYKPDKHNIIIAHNPRLFGKMNEENARDADLVLCGHNHGGGQIRLNKWISAHVIMGLFQSIWHDGFGRWVSGEYKNKSGLRMVLSKGLGLTGISARINCPPEITVIEIA